MANIGDFVVLNNDDQRVIVDKKDDYYVVYVNESYNNCKRIKDSDIKKIIYRHTKPISTPEIGKLYIVKKHPYCSWGGHSTGDIVVIERKTDLNIYSYTKTTSFYWDYNFELFPVEIKYSISDLKLYHKYDKYIYMGQLEKSRFIVYDTVSKIFKIINLFDLYEFKKEETVDKDILKPILLKGICEKYFKIRFQTDKQYYNFLQYISIIYKRNWSDSDKDNKPYKSTKGSYYHYINGYTFKHKDKQTLKEFDIVINATEIEDLLELKCEKCGHTDSLIAYNNKIICKHCMEKTHVYSTYENKWVIKRNAVLTADNIYISKKNIYNGSRYNYCSVCNKLEKVEYVENKPVCNSCIGENTMHCRHCGSRMLNTTADKTHNRCWWCYNNEEKIIHGYHPNIILKKYGRKKTESTFKGFGVELEIDSIHNVSLHPIEAALKTKEITKNHTYCSTDGSLSSQGYEIITHPHTYNQLMKIEWNKLFDYLKEKGYDVNGANNAGLHVHVSREFFGTTSNERNEALSKLAYLFDVKYEDFIKISRRTPERMRSWACKNSVNANKDTAKSMSKTYSNRGALNFNKTYTVEFRYNRGTLDLQTFKTSLDIINTICKNSKVISWEDTDNWKKWLKGCKKETLTYVIEKGVRIDG
ncbi:MAG: hypothetical protein RBR02_06230 [Desulfuromonadaceae bacterium]|nr:hypothetical protein [Desulfuromonadaceae bacterium]